MRHSFLPPTGIKELTCSSTTWRFSTVLLALFVVLSFALAACGGGSSSPSARSQPK
jgi:hypothetical protein